MKRHTLPAGFLFLALALSSCSTGRGPFIHEESRLISPEEAYRLGKLKNTPYSINGRVYVPMSYEQALAFEEVGMASWYGHETLKKTMASRRRTANSSTQQPRAQPTSTCPFPRLFV